MVLGAAPLLSVQGRFSEGLKFTFLDACRRRDSLDLVHEKQCLTGLCPGMQS
jgi:hypothetical protein